jgi:hypothetical protein
MRSPGGHARSLRLALAGAVGCALGIALASGCSKKPKKRKGDEASDATRRQFEQTVGTVDLDLFAQRIEDLVDRRDRTGLRRQWATAATLEGCVVAPEAPEAPELLELMRGRRKTFDKTLKQSMSDKKKGRVLDRTSGQLDQAPTGPGSLFGEGCPARTWGRVAIYVNPAASRRKMRVHSFETALVGTEWKVVNHEFEAVDCGADDSDPPRPACQALAAVTPAAKPKDASSDAED